MSFTGIFFACGSLDRGEEFPRTPTILDVDESTKVLVQNFGPDDCHLEGEVGPPISLRANTSIVLEGTKLKVSTTGQNNVAHGLFQLLN